MAREGRLAQPLHVQFVFGLKNTLPPEKDILAFEVAQLKKMLPDATWTAAGIGRSQLQINHWALELGGHCRTGLEDNVRFDKNRLAASNAELVQRVADLCGTYGRRPATPAQARQLLNLPPSP
ncbi:MAG: 3-keto-5-aminohexanoate cleavage protein [Desulfosarcinaceae bacterium]